MRSKWIILVLSILSLLISAQGFAEINNSLRTPETEEAFFANISKYNQNTKLFTQVLRVTAPELGLSSRWVDAAAASLQRSSDWAMNHGLPAPRGFSYVFQVEAGFGIGFIAGVEVAFLVLPDGNVGIGVYNNWVGITGAAFEFSSGAGVNLQFNVESVEDIAGASLGVSLGAAAIVGGTVNISIGVSSEDLHSARQALQSIVRLKGREAIAGILENLKTARAFAIGTDLGVGGGVETVISAGWETMRSKTVLPPKPDLLKAKMQELRQELWSYLSHSSSSSVEYLKEQGFERTYEFNQPDPNEQP